MPQDPCGSLDCPMCPSLLVLPINLLWNFQTWKFHSRIISYSVNRFLILSGFNRHNKVILLITDNFCCIVPNWGAKSNWGYNFTPLRQHRTTTTGSVDFSLIQLWLAVYNRVVDNSEALKFDVVYSFTRWRQNHCSRLLRSNKYIIRGVVWKVGQSIASENDTPLKYSEEIQLADLLTVICL